MQPLRQCAWCYRVVVDGVYSALPMRKIQSATHGICPRCKDKLRVEIEASLPLAA